jgi:hypothetical protein
MSGLERTSYTCCFGRRDSKVVTVALHRTWSNKHCHINATQPGPTSGRLSSRSESGVHRDWIWTMEHVTMRPTTAHVCRVATMMDHK